MPKNNQDRLAEMPKEELEEALDRAASFASWRLRGCYWQGVYGGTPPAAPEALDLVQFALGKVIDGANWDESKPLWLVLRGIIRGRVNHLAVSLENKNLQDSEDVEERVQRAQAKSDAEAANELPEGAESDEAESDETLLKLTESLADDPDAQKVVEAIWDGAVKRAEIAEVTGFSVDEVTNIRKRLKRKLRDFGGNLS